MWSVAAAVHCKRKLKKHERERLGQELDGMMYTCGESLQDLNLDSPLDEVYVRDLTCSDHIEKLYYSAEYELICIRCATELQAPDTADAEYCPQCTDCKQPKIRKH